MIANSGHDERGKYTGGQAGDQTGTEWQIRTWYNRPWGVVLRYPDKKVADKITELARAAANNNNIGYNQAKRESFWKALKEANYNPADIKVKCDADCSAGVCAIVKAVGYILNIQKLKDVATTNWTGSMKVNLRAAGFEVMTDEKYLTSDKYLLPGDILLNEKSHTCINLDYGDNVTSIFEAEKKEGWVKSADGRWWYAYKDGSYPKSCWVRIEGKEYYFDGEGWLAINQWIKSTDYATNGKLYYVDEDGAWDNKVYKWEKDGKGWWLAQMKSNTYPKEKWLLVDGKWYYAKKNGYIATGTLTIEDRIYSFDKDGVWVG